MGFVASSSGLPIIGLFITSVVSAYGLYQAFSNQKQPVFDRIRDALFIMAMGATNIIGYGILLGTGMIMTPVVAGFFVLSSSLDVVKEIFCMIQEAIQYKQYRSDFNHPDSLSVHRSVHRHEVRYQKHLNAAVINLISALAVVGIMAIWCFLPGALIVTVASIAALAVVYGVKYCALKHNDTTMRNRLQENLTHVLKEHDISTFVKENSSTLEMLPLLNKATEDHQQAAYNSSHGGRGISFFQQSERSYNPISTEKMSPPVSPH